MQIGITQIDYSSTHNGTTLHIFGRDADANPHRIDVTGFVPYFYIPKEQALKMKHPSSMKIDKETVYHSIYGEELRRVNCDSPISIYLIKNLTQHLEGDISYPIRYMIDNHITGGIEVDGDFCDYKQVKPCNIKTKARVAFLDIECSDERGFPEPQRDEITAITVHDSFDDHYTTYFLDQTPNKDAKIVDLENETTHIFTDEKKMLLNFCKFMKEKDHDIISGWNVDDFDADYILKRMDTLGIDVGLLGRLPPQKGDKRGKSVIRGRNIFDLLEAYKKITTASGKRESYRLDAIAEFELGEHKVHFTGSLNQLARTDPQKFVTYNRKDVQLCVGIDRKNNIIEFYRELASFVGCPLDKTQDSSSVVDVYVLRQAYERFVLPSKGFSNDEKFEGATVFPPSAGVEENIIVLDLKSLYPMAMITLNASPETKSKDGTLHSPNGISFVAEPIGLVRGIILELLEQRDAKKLAMKSLKKESNEYKLLDMQQNVLKIIMNTYYGVSGYPRFRMYDQEIAGAVTSTGREIIEYTRKYIESKGYQVKYGDSVTKNTKIDLGNKSVFIEDLFTNVDITTSDGKEYCLLRDIRSRTVTDNGHVIFANVKYVMRHKTCKQIYRVVCDNGHYVDVTEDHSLIALDQFGSLYEIKPTELIIGQTTLLNEYGSMYPVSVTPIDYNDYVYDIEVEDTHRFFANGILVHNTDSSFIKIPNVSDPEEVMRLGHELEKELNALYPSFAKEKLNADVSFFSTKFEKLYRRFFQGGKKKRYAGHITWKEGKTLDEIDVVGYEVKRSDSPQLARDTMKKSLEMILRGSSKEDIRKYLSEVIKKYRKGEYPYDMIGIPGGIGKNLDDYDIADAHVRGCRYANEHLKATFLKGSKPKRLYISHVNGKYPQTDVICFEYGEQVPPEFVVDRETMLNKTLKAPLERIFTSLGWQWSEFDPERTTLAMFGLE